MEKKFESELGKRIVEGNRRKVTKKVALAAFAIITAAAFFGAAAFSVVSSAKAGPPYMTAETLEDHVQSTINNEGGSIAVSRVMTLMTRAFDVETSGGQHMDCFKFVYVMNVQIVDDDSVVNVGDALGDLDLDFTSTVAWYPIQPYMMMTASTYDILGVETPLTADLLKSAVTMDVSVEYSVDETTEVSTPVSYTGITVDVNSPVVLDSATPLMTLSIDIWVYATPDIDGVYSEMPFGDELIAPFTDAF